MVENNNRARFVAEWKMGEAVREIEMNLQQAAHPHDK